MQDLEEEQVEFVNPSLVPILPQYFLRDVLPHSYMEVVPMTVPGTCHLASTATSCSKTSGSVMGDAGHLRPYLPPDTEQIHLAAPMFRPNTHPKNVFISTSPLPRNVAAMREKKRDANRPSPPSSDPDLAV